MDTSLDQFIKDRKIKFPGRGGRGGGMRGNSRGRTNFNRGGRGFNRGFRGQNRGTFQRRGNSNFNNQRNFQRGGFNQQRGGGMVYQRRNFNSGFRRGQMSFRGRGQNFNRQNSFGRGRQQNFGVMRGGVQKRQPFFRQNQMRGGGDGGANNVPTKLYISNLDFGVSNQDIKELFGEFGRFRRFGVNFGQGGQSLGTAEVQYENRMSAVKAVQKYNNVPLDGRPMKLAISGTGANSTVVSSVASTPRNLPMRNMRPMNAQRTMNRGVTKKLVQRSKMTLLRGGFRNRGMGGGNQRGNNRGRPNRGRGGSGRGTGFKRGGKNAAPPSQAQLDAELDAFNAKND